MEKVGYKWKENKGEAQEVRDNTRDLDKIFSPGNYI